MLVAGEFDVVEVDVMTTTREEFALVDAEVNMGVPGLSLKGSGDTPLATLRT